MQRISRIWPLLVLPALAAGRAAALPRLQCPLHGGPAWSEIKTEHVVLRTDLEDGLARHLAETLERVHAFVAGSIPVLLPGSATPLPPLGAIAFADEEQFSRFEGNLAEGTYHFDSAGNPPLMLLRGDALKPGLLAHEMTHHAVRSALGLVPTWLNEGLAAYVQAQGRRTLEHVDPAVLRALLADVRRRPPVISQAEYGNAAMLVRYLLERRRPAFEELVGRLERRELAAAAWRGTLPEYDPGSKAAMARLAGEIDALVDPYWPLGDTSRSPVRLEGRLLGAGEVHEVWLSLPRRELMGAWSTENRKALLAEIGEALSEEPGCLPALEWSAVLEPVRAAAAGRQAIASHPDRARAWLLYARSLPENDGAGREAALRRAVEVEPDSGPALAALAEFLVEGERAGEASRLAEAAVRNRPDVLRFQATLARALGGRGNCRAALELQRHVAELAPAFMPPNEHEREIKFLRDLERRCSAPAP